MATIVFKEWDLVYTRQTRGCRTINGVSIGTHNSDFFMQPTFIGQLVEPTFRYVYKWFEEVYQVDDEDGNRLVSEDDMEVFRVMVERWKSHGIALDTEFYLEPDGGRPQPAKPSVLFEDSNPAEKPRSTHRYDGIRSYTTGSRPLSIYSYNENYESSCLSDDIQAWNYVPDEMVFMSLPKEKTKLYFGLELEVNTKLPWTDIKRVMLEVEPKQEEFLHAMSDSSINGRFENCYEMVTMPMTPRRMRKEWKILFRKLGTKVKEVLGVELEEVFDMDTTSTGIHIHTSTKAYTQYQRKKFSALWNSDIPSILKTVNLLAGRDLLNTHYSRPSPAYEGRRLGYCLREVRYHDKYVACKDDGGSTIEVRVFKGTPTLANVLSCIDAVEAIFYFTLEMPNSAFSNTFPKVFHTWLYKQSSFKYRDLKEKLLCA